MKRVSILFSNLHFVFFIFIFFIWDPCYFAQNSDKSISYHFEQISLRDALNYLIQRFNVPLVYQDAQVEHIFISERCHGCTIEEGLNNLLLKYGLGWHKINTQLIISENGSEKTIKRDIYGKISDRENGNPLPYANIIIKGTKQGTSSDLNGYFKLGRMPAQSCTLQVYYVGYKEEEVIEQGTLTVDTIQIRLNQQPLQSDVITAHGERELPVNINEKPGEIKIKPLETDPLPSFNNAQIERTIQLMPGISASTDRAVDLIFYGGTSAQNMILLDGIPIYKPSHYYGMISMLPPQAIEEVTIYKGGYPARYGDALSGIVELTANEVEDSQLNFGLGLNLYDLHGFLALPISNKIKNFLSLRRSYNINSADHYYQDINKYAREFEEDFDLSNKYNVFSPTFNYFDLLNKLSINLSADDDIYVTSYINNDHEEFDSPFLTFYPDTNYLDIELARDIQSSGYAVNYLHKWMNHAQLKINIGYNQLKHNVYVTSLLDSSFYYYKINDFFFRFDQTYYFKSIGLDFGYEGREIRIENREENRKTDTKIHSVYFQSLFSPFRKFNLTVGLRNTNVSYFLPRASLMYQFSQKIKLSASWGIYNQYLYPYDALNENLINYSYISDLDINWNIRDDKDEVSHAEHFIINFQYDLSDYLFNTELYYKKYNQLLYYNYNENSAVYSDGSGISSGLEIMMKKAWGIYSGWISYHWNHIEYKFPKLFNANSINPSYNRTHELKMVHQINLKSWYLSAIGILSSGARYTKLGEEKNESVSPMYQRFDLHLSREWKDFFKLNWQLGIGLINIFNHKNIWYREVDITNLSASYPPSQISYYDYPMLGFTPMVYLNCKLR
jgi:ferric enterobactin receptor